MTAEFLGLLVLAILCLLSYASFTEETNGFYARHKENLPKEEGWIAGLDGKKIEDNPYPPKSLEAKAWERGWRIFAKQFPPHSLQK